MAAAELAEARAALVARLSNALYGSALAHVMTAEIAVTQAGVDTGYRHEVWRAAGATAEGTAILLHYTAMRLAAELAAISERLPVDLGVIGAAAGAGEALKLLLEVCTVRSMDDPRAGAVTTNLARAADQLGAPLVALTRCSPRPAMSPRSSIPADGRRLNSASIDPQNAGS